MILQLLTFIYASKALQYSGNTNTGTNCKIQIDKLPENAPLLLSMATRDLMYPDYGSSTINVQHGEFIQLACPGAGSMNAGNVRVGTGELAAAICLCGDFKILGYIVDMYTIQCAKRITSVARYTGRFCWGSGREIEIGLDLADGRRLKLIVVCFDYIKRNVLYSHYTLTKFIGKQTTHKPTLSWSEDNFYNLRSRLNDIYPVKEHRKIINRQVGLPEENTTYVKENGQYYISKGHLAAKADFMYSALQFQTYHYINSAPQWLNFNAKNWFNFEKNLRQYASNKAVDLTIYTGTYNVTTLRHMQSGEDVELYLYIDEYGYKAVPIPKIFWKIAYDAKNKAGVVVLGVNNPYDVTGGIICNDIASTLTWLNLDRFNMAKGYVYACTIDDFMRSMPQRLHLEVTHILN